MRRKETHGEFMRSEIIFRAKLNIENKYQLCQTAAKATRRLHISSRDTQQTINNAFSRIAADPLSSLELPDDVRVADTY
jgi:hypothetical protein